MQGVGGAFISANSGAIIADLFPPERRGRAYGYASIGWNVGAVLGILVGGLLVTYLSWRWIFWINVPIGVAALLLALRALPADHGYRHRTVDPPGMVAVGVARFSLLWAMVQLTTAPFGLGIALWLTAGVVLLLLFLVHERRSADPMVDLSLFQVPTLLPSFLASFFQGLANFAVLFLITMYLQGMRGLTPLSGALLLAPGYLVGGVVAPFVGRLADRVGPVPPATAGLAAQIVAMLLYAHLALTTPLWVVSATSIVNGLGSGSFFPANNAAVTKAAPRHLFGVASGLLHTFANAGMVFSFSTALFVAAHALSRGLAFAIFVGNASLPAGPGRRSSRAPTPPSWPPWSPSLPPACSPPCVPPSVRDRCRPLADLAGAV